MSCKNICEETQICMNLADWFYFKRDRLKFRAYVKHHNILGTLIMSENVIESLVVIYFSLTATTTTT